MPSRLSSTAMVRIASTSPTDTAVHPLSEQSIPRVRLLQWNAALFLFHTVLAVLTFSLGKLDLSASVYRVRNGIILSNETWSLAPVLEPAGNLPFTAMVGSFFIITALFHLLNATLLRDVYIRELGACRTPTRWCEYFFSASIVAVLIAYTIGVRERFTLLAIAGLVASTMPYGFWTEQISRPKSPGEWSAPLATRLLPWLLGHVPQMVAWGILVACLASKTFCPRDPNQPF